MAYILHWIMGNRCKNEEKVKEKTRTKDGGGPLFSVDLFTHLSAIFSFGRVQMRKRQQVLFFTESLA